MALTVTILNGTFHLTGNPIHVEVTGATGAPGARNYKALCKVISVDNVLIGGPFIDAKTPDNTGKAVFDISGYCDQPVEKTFEFPLSGGLNPYTNDTIEITVTPGQSYIDEDGDLVEEWGSASESNFVIKGGLGPRELGKFNDQNSSFYAYYVSGGRFLTRLPSPMVVAPWQPVKLWLLCKDSADHSVRIKGYYEDGSNYTKSNTHTFYKDIMHEINFLPYHMDSTNLPPVKGGVKMLYYEAWIEGLTSKFVFTLDHNYHEQCNYLMAVNSLGGIDCIWLSGEVVKGFKTSSSEAVRQFPSNGKVKTRTIIIAGKTWRRTWKINSGWKTKEEIEAIKELFSSDHVWLIENGNGYNLGDVFPVVIENSSGEPYDSNDTLHSVQIEMSEAHNSQYV